MPCGAVGAITRCLQRRAGGTNRGREIQSWRLRRRATAGGWLRSRMLRPAPFPRPADRDGLVRKVCPHSRAPSVCWSAGRTAGWMPVDALCGGRNPIVFARLEPTTHMDPSLARRTTDVATPRHDGPGEIMHSLPRSLDLPPTCSYVRTSLKPFQLYTALRPSASVCCCRCSRKRSLAAGRTDLCYGRISQRKNRSRAARVEKVRPSCRIAERPAGRRRHLFKASPPSLMLTAGRAKARARTSTRKRMRRAQIGKLFY